MKPVAVPVGDNDWATAIHPVGNLASRSTTAAYDGAYRSRFLAKVRQILETATGNRTLVGSRSLAGPRPFPRRSRAHVGDVEHGGDDALPCSSIPTCTPSACGPTSATPGARRPASAPAGQDRSGRRRHLPRPWSAGWYPAPKSRSAPRRRRGTCTRLSNSSSTCSPTLASGCGAPARLPGGLDRHRKICAIGVRISKGRSMHGFALNVDPTFRCFEHSFLRHRRQGCDVLAAKASSVSMRAVVDAFAARPAATAATSAGAPAGSPSLLSIASRSGCACRPHGAGYRDLSADAIADLVTVCEEGRLSQHLRVWAAEQRRS